MGRSPCCDKVGLKKGPWTPEEDQKLLAYIEEHGHGNWRSLPANAGLQRCGKSCRLRWTNYLRPDIKRGKFTLQEEQTITQLHALLGNRWSAIATHLPKRTDNEIKNYWNTHLKKRLTKMGIDPVTHKPKTEALFMNNGQSKDAANLSHMAQWESARLEAEARLIREAKLRSCSIARLPKTSWSSTVERGNGVEFVGSSWDQVLTKTAWSSASDQQSDVEFVMTASGSSDTIKDECNDKNKSAKKDDLSERYKGNMENSLYFGSGLLVDHIGNEVGEERLTNLRLNDSIGQSLSDDGKEYSGNSCGSDYYEGSKNYWNSILDLVNSSPSDSLMF